MLHYADIIQECQDDLGLQVSSFHDIGKSALAFYSSRAAQIAQKNNGNSGNNNQEQISEEYLTDNDQIDQYEQERLTDDNAYSEYFQDDYNKADRLTS
jgi:hypothetical protein